jgi:hypothetical protein
VPEPDPVAREYLLLALRLDQHLPGLVDAYYGPRDLKARVDMENLRPPSLLAADARALRDRVGTEVAQPDRRRWLDRQLVALETLAARRGGEEIPYEAEVARCFDAAPAPHSPGWLGEVHRDLERLLPGRGHLADRLEEWEAPFAIPPERVPAVVDALLPGLRAAALAALAVPDGETVRVGMVTGQPWSGYNWYLGGLRSRVDLNADLPLRAVSLLETLTHETYPGHHLEHAWKEQRLVLEQGRLEASVLLIDTPECYLSEGLAELGGRLVLDGRTRMDLLGLACRTAGLRVGEDDLSTATEIAGRRHALRAADGDAALMLHAAGRPRAEVLDYLREVALLSPARAAKRLEFIEHPLWRSYVFSYAGGEALLRDWCDPAGPAEVARGRFFRLLTEQLTPSGIDEMVRAGKSTGGSA